MIYEKVINGHDVAFKMFDIEFEERNVKNIFIGNQQTLGYTLSKAMGNEKNRLHSIAKVHLSKYGNFLDCKLGQFLYDLKIRGEQDYKKYLNAYGDLNYCRYKVNFNSNDKGIYCYVVDDEIKYIGRSKCTFGERLKGYSNITAYNCLIDGQSTNCRINALLNDLAAVRIGFYKMNDQSDSEISIFETELLKNKLHRPHWNRNG